MYICPPSLAPSLINLRNQVLTGKGDFFSAGADVKATRFNSDPNDARASALSRLGESNLDLARCESALSQSSVGPLRRGEFRLTLT